MIKASLNSNILTNEKITRRKIAILETIVVVLKLKIINLKYS